MDKYVVGQNEAKRTLAVGVYSHYRRLSNNEQHRDSNHHQIPIRSEGNIPHGILHTNSSLSSNNASTDYVSTSRFI